MTNAGPTESLSAKRTAAVAGQAGAVAKGCGDDKALFIL